MAELSNSKPQIFADLMTEGLELERACQSVLGRRRAFYSRVEAAGEDRKVFAAVLRIRAKGNSVEHQETQRQIAQRLLWLGMPLGTQAGLFGDLQPPTDAATRTIGLANAKDLGYSAGASNQPPSANPCKPGTELHRGSGGAGERPKASPRQGREGHQGTNREAEGRTRRKIAARHCGIGCRDRRG